jgi:hypothetical protein
LKFAKALLIRELKTEARASSQRRAVAATSLKAGEEGIAFAATSWASEVKGIWTAVAL